MSQEQWSAVRSTINAEWDATIVPALSAYIKVPNQSPHYDAEWATNGLIDQAFAVLVDWLKVQPVAGLKYELHSEPGRTPFLVVEIPASAADKTGKTVLLYGHMDKQPPLLPWGEGLDPYTPVIRDGKLYGRGGADDGYAIFAAVTSIAALQKAGIPHARAVITIEACEESGSYDLPFYINKCKAQIGDVDLVVCLDSGASNYDQLWLTSSLRGVTGGTLTIQALKESIHSGIGGGVVPDSFHIFRILLDRLHDAHTGTVKLKDLHVPIPEKARKGLESLRDVDFQGAFPLLPGAKFEGAQPPDNAELAIRNFWMPAVTVTGADMVPAATAGNVVRKDLVAKISVRCPPTLDANKASLAVKQELERDPPFGASVRFDGEFSGSGWAPPELKPWLESAVNNASAEYFGKPAGAAGMGGSIPFMGMLGEMYPEAQFVVTGVLGPQSNAHGPNEFIHIPFAKGINFCVSRILGAHYASHN